MLRYQGNDLQMRFLFGALPCLKSVPFLPAFVSCPLPVPAPVGDKWALSPSPGHLQAKGGVRMVWLGVGEVVQPGEASSWSILVFWASPSVRGCDTLLFFLGTKGQNCSCSPAPDAGAVLGLRGQCPPGAPGLCGLASLPV